MDRFWIWVSYLAAVVVAWWTGLHDAYRGLLFLQGIDLAMGVAVALKRHKFRSSIGRAGIRRKLAMWGLIGAAYVLQVHGGAFGGPPSTPDGYGIAEWAALALAFMEFSSVIENAGRLGVSVPPVLLAFLEKVKDVFGLTSQSGDKDDEAEKGE